MALLCPAKCCMQIWFPEDFWQERMALAGEGQCTQEGAVKIKQCVCEIGRAKSFSEVVFKENSFVENALSAVP